MKKAILIISLTISVVFLCAVFGIAQKKTITRSDFERLVDYAVSKYVMAFIEIKDAENVPYMVNTYEKSIKPILGVASLYNLNDTPDEETILGLLADNNSAKNLAGVINLQKDNYDLFQDDDSLLSSLGIPAWDDTDLSQVSVRIVSDIAEHVKSGFGNNKNPGNFGGEGNNEIQSSEREALQVGLEQLHRRYENLKTATIIMSIVVIAVAGLGLVLVAMLRKEKKMLIKSMENTMESRLLNIEKIMRQAVEEIKLLKQRCDSLEFQINKNQVQNALEKQTVNRINTQNAQERQSYFPTNKNQTQNNELPRNIDRINTQNDNTPEIVDKTTTMVVTATEKLEKPEPVVKYLLGITKDENGFNRVVDSQISGCFFKIFDETADTARFELCVDVSKAQNNNIFEYTKICKYAERNKPGTLVRNNGKWTVKEPVEVKI